MKAWFEGLASREQHLLIISVAVLLILFLYVGAWEPLQQRVETLHSSNADQQALLGWMRNTAQEIQQRRGAGNDRSRVASGQSLLSLVDKTARSGGLGEALKRVQPDGQQRVGVWLEGASFDDLMRWLSSLGKTHGIGVVTSVFEAKEATGRVDARLVFEAAG